MDRLSGRMHQKHFPYNDPLKIAADEAADAVGKLDEVVKQIAAEKEKVS